MCPLYPFHFVLLYLCLLLPLLFAVVEGSEELFANWKVTFLPGKVHQLQVGNRTNVTLMCEDCDVPDDLVSRNFKMALLSDDPKVRGVYQRHSFVYIQFFSNAGCQSGT